MTRLVRVRAASLILCMSVAACGSHGSSELLARGPAVPSPSHADFGRVAARVGATAESLCAERAEANVPDSCDFTFVLDGDPGAPPNAFQSQARDGSPVVTVTASLLAQLQNDHEIAAVLSHEAAHYVAGHIAQMNGRAARDTYLPEAGLPDRIGGGSATRAGRAHALELEADWLGTFIAARSGYEPETGAGVLKRAAAKQGRPLSQTSSHPHPAKRLEVVAAAVAEIHRQNSTGLTPQP